MSNNTISLEQVIEKFEKKFLKYISLRIAIKLEQFITQVWHDARKEALDEVLEKMPEEYNILEGEIYEPHQHGFNTAIIQLESIIKQIK